MNPYYLNNFRKLTGLSDPEIIKLIKESELPYNSLLSYLIYHDHLPDKKTAAFIRDVGVEMYFHLLKTGVTTKYK